MGSQMGYTGRIGNVVHYKMGNKYYSRSLPGKYKQTKATKAKSSEFGMASTIGKVIRENLGTVIFETTDRKMQTRLVGKIFQWLPIARHRPASASNQPPLELFRFSSGSPALSSRWLVKYEVSSPAPGQIQIAIPSFIPTSAFRVPEDTTAVVCRIASVVIDVEKKMGISSAKNEIRYELNPKKVAAQSILQELPMAAGSLLVTGMCLEYRVFRYQNEAQTNDKRFRPSQIIYAVYN